MALTPFIISTKTLNFFGTQGLVSDINLILFFNAFISPFAMLYLEINFLKKIWKKNLLNNFLKTGEGEPFTQKDALEIEGWEDFEVGKKYSYILSTISITFFYLEIFPFGAIYGLLGVFLWYLTSKVS